MSNKESLDAHSIAIFSNNIIKEIKQRIENIESNKGRLIDSPDAIKNWEGQQVAFKDCISIIENTLMKESIKQKNEGD